MILDVSIIFPIFNEEKRLHKSFRKIKNYLKHERKRKVQLIFVDDGSNDKTLDLIKKFKKNFKNNHKINIVAYKPNKGKGRAIYEGTKFAIYDWVLTADIDLSVDLKQLNYWENKNYIKKQNLVYIGSRSHKKSKVKKNFFRYLLGSVLSFCIKKILKINLIDTQCGFKLYKKHIAKKIFKNLLRPRFEHDIEVLLRLIMHRIKIIELPIKWVHKKDGKVNLLLDPIRMFIGIMIIKLNYY